MTIASNEVNSVMKTYAEIVSKAGPPNLFEAAATFEILRGMDEHCPKMAASVGEAKWNTSLIIPQRKKKTLKGEWNYTLIKEIPAGYQSHLILFHLNKESQ